ACKMNESSSLSLAPPGESMAEVHAGNRERLVAALRAHLSAAGRPLRGIVLLKGGEEQTRYCTDHVPLFRQESYFAYLFGVREPGFYGAVDIGSGQSILFAPRFSPDDAIWNGKPKKLPYFKDMYKVDSVFYVDELAQVLRCECSEHGHGEPLLFLLYGQNTDSGNYSRPASFEGMDKFDTDLSTLHPILTECRVTKSDMELALIQHANDVSSEAHVEVMRKIKPGMTENQLESTFRCHASMPRFRSKFQDFPWLPRISVPLVASFGNQNLDPCTKAAGVAPTHAYVPLDRTVPFFIMDKMMGR
uniref:Aminopeptidase P N-terminal domain-containing protein n=1 Tax=Aegilops tauschii subsp. strangulata TaxID=200361 RepID=A0A452XZX7_AEGTS